MDAILKYVINLIKFHTGMDVEANTRLADVFDMDSDEDGLLTAVFDDIDAEYETHSSGVFEDKASRAETVADFARELNAYA